MSAFDTSTKPVLPTSVVEVTADGRVVCADNSVWAWFSIPLAPTVDAKTLHQYLEASDPLMGALTELAALTSIKGVKRRFVQKSAYRQYQILGVNLDAYFEPPLDHALYHELVDEYSTSNDVVIRRCALLGIRLVPKLGKKTVKETVDQFVATFVESDVIVSDFDKDFFEVRSLMARHGLGCATKEEVALARSWWSGGKTTGLYYMSEPERFHFFDNADSARLGSGYARENLPYSEWPDLQGHTVMTFASVTEMKLPWVSVFDYGAQWFSDLIANGALCISINGLLEPGAVTAKEVESQIEGYESDIKERYKVGKDAHHEQEQKLAMLGHVRDLYGGINPPPISTRTSITVAFNGDGSRFDSLNIPGVNIEKLASRQTGAFAETFLGPVVRTNPALHDLPLTTIAYSGLCSLSTVGDDARGSAFVGYTERDHQPVWSNPGAAMTLADSPPLFGIFGQSGSGKTMVGVKLCIDYARLGHKSVFVDPKERSDFTALFSHYGGSSIHLAEIASSEGIVDPLRFSLDAKDGISQAASMLRFINPWGSRGDDMELPVTSCLRYGVERGARSILSALYIARDEGFYYATDPDLDLVRPIEEVAKAVPFASALIGHTDTGKRLAFDNNLTYIRVGDAQLDLPQNGVNGDIPLSQRVAVAMIRMLVRGSTIAVRGNEGVVGLDEAWIFFDQAGKEVESLGRLARSQSVAVILATQKVQDAVNAGVEDHISSGMILGMNSETEARAACTMLHLEPTPDRLERMLAKKSIQGIDGRVRHNYNSMRALIDPRTREVERGSIAIFADVHDRAVYTEIRLSDEFLALASTNILDRNRRLGV